MVQGVVALFIQRLIVLMIVIPSGALHRMVQGAVALFIQSLIVVMVVIPSEALHRMVQGAARDLFCRRCTNRW
jgi:hypothetical protein